MPRNLSFIKLTLRLIALGITLISLSLPEISHAIELSPIDNGTPWTFHTGRFFRIHPVFKSWTKCDSNTPEADGCKEKIFRFTEDEIIEKFTGVQRELSLSIQTPASELRTRNALNEALILGSSIASTVRYGILLTKDAPTPWTKAAFVGLIAFDGAYIWWLWHDAKTTERKIESVRQKINSIRSFLAQEADYTERCGHPRANFVAESAKLGVLLPFLEYGGEYVDPSFFENSMETENKQIDKLTADRNIPFEDIYQSENFLNQCDQIALTYEGQLDHDRAVDDTIWEMFWPNTPKFLAKATKSLSRTRLKLATGAPIGFSNFPKGKLSSEKALGSVSEFLSKFSTDLSRLENSNQSDLLDRFRNEYSQVLVKYREKKSTRYYSTGPYYPTMAYASEIEKSYDVVEIPGSDLFAPVQKVLIFYAVSRQGEIQINYREFFEKEFNISF